MRKIVKKIAAGILSAALLLGGTGEVRIASAEKTSGQQETASADMLLPTDDYVNVKVVPLTFAEQLKMQQVPCFDGADVQNSLNSLDPVIRGGIGSYGKSQLSEKQKELYDAMEVACVAFVKSNQDIKSSGDAHTGSASYQGMTQAQMTQTFVAFYYDHPVYCWIDGYSYSGTSMCVRVKEDYYTDSSRDAVDNWIKSGVAEYKAQTDRYSDTWEKVRDIHDKMILDVEYAYKSNGSTPESAAWAHNVEGVFNPAKKSVVCEGYSKAFSLITNYLGIPSIFIVGKGDGGAHAWNAVSFDGGNTYSYMDLTWDDAKGENVGYIWFATPKSGFTKRHKAYTTKNTEMNWQYALPDMTGNMTNTYFAKYHAYATNQEVYDDTSAKSFLQTAGACVPGERMMILAATKSIMSMLLRAYNDGLNSYYLSTEYGTEASYQIFDATRYKVKNPAKTFTLNKTTISVNKDATPTQILTVNAPSGSDDRIVVSVDNSRVVSLSKSVLDLSKGENQVTLTFKATGNAVITVTSMMGKYEQTCNVTVSSSIASEHLYLDKEHRTVANSQAFAYASGGTKKVNNVSTNYKTVTLYTDLVPPVYKDAKGRSNIGRVLAGVTLENKEPAVKDNKIVKDAEAEKLASASFKKITNTEGSVTVTAKKPGFVYVWLFALTAKDTIQTVGYAPVELKPAPTKVIFQDEGCQAGKITDAFQAVTSKAVALNTSFNIYLNPTVSAATADNKKLRETVTENTFSLSVPDQWKPYIKVESLSALYGYKITPLKLQSETKETKIPLTAVCGENGTNAKLTVTITNRVKKMRFEKLEGGSDTEFSSTSGTLKLKFTQSAGVVNRTVKFRETVEAYASGKRFDGTKIYQLPRANGFTITNAGKVTVEKGITAEQKKVVMSVVRGTQTETGAEYLITAKAGISDGLTAYLLVVHNGLAGKGTGYDVIEVTVGNSGITGNEHPIWANAKDIERKKTKLNTTLTPVKYLSGNKTVEGKIVWISCQNKLQGAPDFDQAGHKLKMSSDSTVASVAAGGIVTAKSGGKAYIYAVETGSGNYEEFEVDVKDTPLNIRMYDKANANPVNGDAEYKKATVAQGGKAEVYVKGTVGSITKKKNTMQLLTGEGYEYEYALSAKDTEKGYVSVSQEGEHFTIQTANDAWTKAGLTSGKKLTVKVDFICIKNGRKGTFTLTITEK